MDIDKHDFRSERDKDLDLELENRTLELDLELKGGCLFIKEDVDPKLHNTFLKQVAAFKELDKEPKHLVRSLFPDGYEFPSSKDITAEELEKKLSDILKRLKRNNLWIEPAGNPPDRVLYDYVVKEVIYHETMFPALETGMREVFDGCDGYCPECFQKEYCSIKDEIAWDED